MWPFRTDLDQQRLADQHRQQTSGFGWLGSATNGLSGGLSQLGSLSDIQWTTGTTNIQLGVVPAQVTPSPAHTTPTPEGEIAWLRRRVREVMWQP